MTRTEKRNIWKTHFETWKASDQSIAGWCRKHAISVDQMYYWVRRFENDGRTPDPAPTEWLAVDVDDAIKSPSGQDSICIHMDAISVEVRPGADVALLSDILEILKNPC